jgi:hypothetical protein
MKKTQKPKYEVLGNVSRPVCGDCGVERGMTSDLVIVIDRAKRRYDYRTLCRECLEKRISNIKTKK